MTSLFKPPTHAEFAELIRRRAQEAGLAGDLEYLPEAFALTTPGSNSVRMNLGNLYAEYCAAPLWRRKTLVTRYAQLFAHVSPAEELITPEDARAHLLPRIRERVVLENMAMQAQIEDGKRPEFVSRVVGEHLTLEVVYDRPDSIVSVSKSQLDDWGLPFDEALALAGSNLLTAGTANFRALRPGLYVSDWHDNYDASRMHLPEVLAALPIQGRPVAMVPNRDVLLVTGAEDAGGLAAMAHKAEETLKLPRPMCGLAFRLDAGWVPFLPPSDHPAYPLLHRLSVQTIAGYYDGQKRLLDALHQKDGVDLMVDALMVLQNKAHGDWETIAVWSQGVDTLLPRAERVAFVTTDSKGDPQPLGLADWDRVIAVMGNQMEAQELYPERWRVREFPSPEQLSEIGLT